MIREFITYRSILIIAAALMLFSCTEVYKPDIDAEEKVLIVEALVTNEYAPNVVKLHYGIPFDSIISPVPVRGAKVYVRDQNNFRYDFSEKEPGYYYSDRDEFLGKVSTDYTLIIETSDGESYQSEKESMILKDYSESGYATFVEKSFLEENLAGEKIVVKENWVDVFVNVNASGDILPKFRYAPLLVIESVFNRVPPGKGESFPHYSWRTLYPEFELTRPSPFTINDNTLSGQTQINEQPICSFRNETFIYARDSMLVEDYYHPGVFVNIPIDTMISSIVNRVLIIKEFQLNKTSYEYYNAIKEQLIAENKVFDPIPTQLNGNIKCMSNPDKKVIGLFEVSSINLNAYTVRPFINRNAVEVEKVLPMIPYPYVGTQMDVPPDFWIP